MATELETIRRVRVEATTSGVEKATAALEGLAGAQQQVGTSGVQMGASTDTGAKKITSAAGAYQRLVLTIDAAAKSQFEFERGQRKITNALEQGLISTQEAARSTDLLRAKWVLNDNAVQAAGKSSGRTAAQLSNLSFQLNDIASGLAMGQSPFTILAQQGGQLLQVLQMGEGGISGTFAKVAASIAAVATPANIAGAAVVALGAGFLAYSALSRSTLPTVDEAIKTHTDLIAKIKEQYGEATIAANEYARDSKAVVGAALRGDITALQKQAQAATTDFVNSVTSQQSQSRSGQGPRVVSGEFAAFKAEIEDFRRSIKDGIGDFSALREAIAVKMNAEPANKSLQELGARFMENSKELLKVTGNLDQASGTMDKFARDAATAALNVKALTKALNDMADVAKIAPTDEEQARNAYARGLLTARTAGDFERVRAANAAAQDRIAGANMPLPGKKPNLTDYDTDAPYTAQFRGAQDRIRDLLLETTALGKASGAAESYRLQQKILTELQRDGGVVTEDQRKQIEQLADAYGVLVEAQKRAALTRDLNFEKEQIGRNPVDQNIATQMRAIYGDSYLQHMEDFGAIQIRNNAALKAMADAGKSARDAMETLQLRLALIGKPAEEAAAAMAGLQADQQARDAGIAGTSQAASIREAAVAQAHYNSVAERTVAAWDEIKDTGGSAIDSFVDKIADGTLSLESFLDVAKDIGKEILKLGVANPLKNALFGDNLPTLDDARGVLGQVFGGKSNPITDAASSLATSAVASMNVTAASVVINGGIGAALGANDNILPKGIGSDAVAGGALNYARGSFQQVNDKLKDILQTAASQFPMKVDAISGFRAGDPRFHGQGLATDVQIFDKLGKAIPNYQSGAGFRTYEQFAQTARQVQLEKYPELTDQFRWGGYFSGPKGKYGAADAMHFDLGGNKVGMGGGSWEGGLNSAQRNYFPEAESVGKSFRSVAAASDVAAKSASGLGGGLGDLTNSVSGAASKIGQLAGGGSGISLGGLNYAALGAPAAGGVYAKGDAFLHGAPMRFARGDIFHKSTLFPMANGGVGEMGEAGPEAIMPLRRDASGRLGVASTGKGGGGMNVVINNNHSGAKVTAEERVNEKTGQRELVATVDEMTATSIRRRGGATSRELAGMGVAPRTRKLG
ncbi:Phage-related minor tail protein [Kaistia soli DSM 19436]|uniref:Phage-related minor tail protein n=1 Tax=Kaistia soli DSM 19436 TaxID=1122133 RepID=A0A1M4YBB0_9HYPH|nr:phage tail length tape measure family protein [Kaistia soli]SHF02782.1 Phage-related minor tail protein [Kaistia soli DSM 19436]